MAGQQRNLDIWSVVGDRAATTFDGTPAAILDGINVTVEFLGRNLKTPAGTQERS